MASNFYREQDSPKFLLGHGLELAFAVMGIIAVLVLRLNYARINKSREEQLAHGEDLTEEEMSWLGDRSPAFRYIL
jgi:3-oxoacyl-(acyl-carrier-protein) synthase